MMSRSILSMIALGAIAGTAAADDADGAAAPPTEEASPAGAPSPEAAPPPARLPGVTLAAGTLNVAVNLEINLSAEAVAKPLSIAPDVAYGISDDLTAALIHSTYGLTGFRAKAGGGLCLSGKDNRCANVYDNVGAEAWYSLARGPLAVAAVGGFHAISLDAGYYDLKVGAKLKYTAGKVALIAQPSVLVGLTKREAAGVALNKDSLWIPVQLTYKVTAPVTIGVGSGLKGPIQGFGDGWQVPLGFMGQYAVNKQLGVGLSWTFGALLGGATNPPDPAPGVKGLDPRGVQLWASYTR